MHKNKIKRIVKYKNISLCCKEWRKIMSREFVDAIISNNNIEAEKSFTASVSTKVGDALEIKRKEISANFVSNVSPEPEETDEDT